MAFSSLADRISGQPLILCGPILRRVEVTSITVWVALREEKKVWLEVYEDISDSGSPPNLKKILTGERKTIRPGKLHSHSRKPCQWEVGNDRGQIILL